jgi:integrase
MKYVQPIREAEKINNIIDFLKKNDERNCLLFVLGIYSGLRISDILKLKVKDVKNQEYISIKEKKTRKMNHIPINPVLKKVVKDYCFSLEDGESLFMSRQGYNKPISRVRAWQIMNEIGKIFSIGSIGTHTLRKTFGYHFYKATKDVATLMILFNHSDPSITLKYIGITNENINQQLKRFKI